MIEIRGIAAADDARIAAIIRTNLEKFHLDIPGTAYFDPELSHLSRFYLAKPKERGYFVALEDGVLLGGVGFAEFPALAGAAELQKLYLSDAAKGKGLGKKLFETAEAAAQKAGYRRAYLETHSNLTVAIALYQKENFKEIPKPDFVFHTTMDRFFIRDL